MRLLFVLLVALLTTSPAWGANDASRLSKIDACHSAVMNVSPGDFEGGMDSSILTTCDEMYISDDVGIQTLSFILGEPVYYALELMKAVTGVEHGMEEDSPSLSYFQVMHTIFGVINNAFFAGFLFLASIVFSAQMWKWAKGDDSVSLKEWLSLHGTSIGFSGIMSAPVVGWMSTIQFLATAAIVGVIYVSKTAVTLLFLGAFFGDVAGEVVDSAKPGLEQSFKQTTLMYQCDLNRRESMIKELVASTGFTSKTQLESDPLFSCLVAQNVTPDASVFGALSDDGFRATVSLTLPAIAQTEKCAVDNASHMSTLGMSDISSCGSASISLPAGNPDDYSSMLALLKNIFVSRDVHVASRNIAITLTEYLCREKISDVEGAYGDLESLCYSPVVAGDGYSYKWLTDISAGTEQLLKLNMPMSNSSADEMRLDVSKLQSAVISSVLSKAEDLTGLAKSAFENVEQESAPIVESGVDSVVGKMRRGAWMIGGLYFSDIGDDVAQSAFVSYLSSAYKAELNIYSSQAIMQTFDYSMSSYEKVFSGANKGGVDYTLGVIPSSAMYWDQLSCWYKQSECAAMSLNPFNYMSDIGVGIIEHSLHWYVVSKVTFEIANRLSSLGSKSRLMIGDVFSSLHLLYVLLGLVLVFGVPLIFVLKIMTTLFYWTYDVIKELLGLQIAFCFSPLGHLGDNLVQQDIRASLHRMMGLAGYFFFVIAGIILSFVSFAFLFSFNVLVVGALSNMIGFGQSGNSVDSVVFRAIFDTVVVVIIVFEAKECSKLLDSIPKAILEHYGLQMTSEHGVAEQIVSKFRDYVLPGVGNFMASLTKQ